MMADLWKELAEGRKAEIERLRAERDELLALLKHIGEQGYLASCDVRSIARLVAKAEGGK